MPRAFDLELERRWRERLREFERSGLAVREFCRDQHVPEYTFFWWRRELVKRDRLRQAARSSSRSMNAKKSIAGRQRHAARSSPLQSFRRQGTRRAIRRRRAEGQSSGRAELPGRTPAFVPVQLMAEPRGAKFRSDDPLMAEPRGAEPRGDSCMEFRIGACLVRVPTTIEERALRQAIRVAREEAAGC